MSETTHTETNYMGVFWWLLVLTIAEIAVIYMPIVRLAVVILLVSMAVTKATLVALYFMHLKFENRTLALIALCPFVLCVFLILMLTPDIFPR
jgi:cytochrome c oxidase subunit IV